MIQQLIELQRENIELRQEGNYERPSRSSQVRNPERPTIALGYSDGDCAQFMDTWGLYKEICLLKNQQLINSFTQNGNNNGAIISKINSSKFRQPWEKRDQHRKIQEENKSLYPDYELVKQGLLTFSF